MRRLLPCLAALAACGEPDPVDTDDTDTASLDCPPALQHDGRCDPDRLPSCRDSTDVGDDGTVDSLIERTFNDRLLPLSVRFDHDADGAWDTVWTYTHDGDIETFAQDADGDGTVDSRPWTRWTPDRQRVLEFTSDADADGTWESRSLTTYDTLDRPTRTTTDDGDDGSIDRTSTTTWTGARPDGDEVESYDETTDGTPDRRIARVWADGRELSTRVDEGADGTWDSAVARTFDGDLLQRFETDADGVPGFESATTYTYDDRGLLARTDTTRDGVPTFRVTYTRDADGVILNIVSDDLTAGTTTRTTYDRGCLPR